MKRRSILQQAERTGDGGVLAPAPALDAHHGGHSHLAIILIIILGSLALLAALIYKESRKAKPKGLSTESRKLDEGTRDDAYDTSQGSTSTVNGKTHVLPFAQQMQAKVAILAKKKLKPDNHEQMHATHVPLVHQSLTLDSRKLITLREGWPSFNMDDLLKSSAEPLHGMGVFGTTYKVTQKGLPTVVIKHLQNVDIGHQAFKNRIEDLAKLNHANVLPIVAYYFSDKQKVLLYEYISFGNLSARLHGTGKEGWVPLEWPKRAQIAMDVARGIAYIHGKGRKKGLVHGNVKPANVVLRNDGGGACLIDMGISHLLNAYHPALNMGYRAPEVVNRPLTYKSDVYSYGVLLLELLTGKQPLSPSSSNQILDLPRLIHSCIHEEWTAEIFDPQIPLRSHYEEEMVLLLKIAMECVQASPRERPSMAKVVGMIKLMKDFEDPSGSAYTDISTPNDRYVDQEFV